LAIGTCIDICCLGSPFGGRFEAEVFGKMMNLWQVHKVGEQDE
jgi:hypothetical protein